MDVTDSVGCPAYQKTSQPDSTGTKQVVIGISSVDGVNDRKGYDPLTQEGRAISTNYSGGNTLLWSNNGNLKITNDASWLTIRAPFNSVASTEVRYAKDTTGNSEYRLTRYLTVRLNEINGSDTIVKTVSNERVFDLPGTGGLTSTLPFAVNGGIGEFNFDISDEDIDPGLYQVAFASYHRGEIVTLVLMIR